MTGRAKARPRNLPVGGPLRHSSFGRARRLFSSPGGGSPPGGTASGRSSTGPSTPRWIWGSRSGAPSSPQTARCRDPSGHACTPWTPRRSRRLRGSRAPRAVRGRPTPSANGHREYDTRESGSVSPYDRSGRVLPALPICLCPGVVRTSGLRRAGLLRRVGPSRPLAAAGWCLRPRGASVPGLAARCSRLPMCRCRLRRR
jgi:hypothetical protein